MRGLEKNEVRPWLVKEWCIPGADTEFVVKMGDVLEVYQCPYDSLCPVVCIDETNKQLIKETHIPREQGQPEKVDSVYVLNVVVVDVFMISEPLVERFEWHYAPKYGSWLDMAEIEIGIMSRQVLAKPLLDLDSLKNRFGLGLPSVMRSTQKSTGSLKQKMQELSWLSCIRP